MKARRRHAGFTLLEILVAIGIVAVMGALMASSFALMHRAQRRTMTRQERYHAGWVALERMARELSMAYISAHFNPEEPRTKTIFDGDDDRVLFTTFAYQRRRSEAREADQAVVEYFVKSTKHGRRGLFRRVKVPVDDDPDSGGHTDLVVDGVERLELSYWNRDDESWEKSWEVTTDDLELGPGGAIKPAEETDVDKELALPWRVRIRLTLRTDDGDDIVFETQTAPRIHEPLNFLRLRSIAARRGAAAVGGRGAPRTVAPAGGGGRR